nr:e3 ubiquitin-protein ligase rsp5 [Quercus suber]
MFELLGILFGLALHNGITLPVNLPLSFYRELLNDRSIPNIYALDDEGEVQLADLQDGWPALHRSFLAMLKQQEAPLYVDYVFPVDANGLRLTITSQIRDGKSVLLVHDVTSDSHQRRTSSTNTRYGISNGETDDTGTYVTAADNDRYQVDGGSADLLFRGGANFINWPGWSFIPSSEEPAPVTNDNKQSYVKDYASWVIKTSVKPQCTAFKKGFSTVLPICLIQFLSAEQLKNTFEGTTKLSIPDLQKATRYQGYDPTSKYIQSFWKIVNSWREERQKGLLKFVTAAERIPIGGAGSLTFIIERTDFGDPEQLPTSSTCFGTLRLPRYSSPEVLESKLRMAIEYGGEGFGSA